MNDVQFNENQPCEACGKYGAFEFDGRNSYGESYESSGSCGPEFTEKKEEALRRECAEQDSLPVRWPFVYTQPEEIDGFQHFDERVEIDRLHEIGVHTKIVGTIDVNRLAR